MRVTIKSQLTGNTLGQAVEHNEVLGCEVTLGEVYLLVAADILSLGQSQHVIQLGNQLLDGRDELDNTLGDNYCTEVVTISSTNSYCISNICYDIIEAHSLLLNLLRNETDIGLSLQSALQGDVRC